MVDILNPSLDPSKLSVEDKIALVRQSDGLLVDILEGLKIKRDLWLRGCSSLTHLPEGLKVGDMFVDQSIHIMTIHKDNGRDNH
ncbi:MAG: hypothetical protein GF411_14830 [Candidatus Lokiarchaeota archaeon]|nr:hypothetical protein [Candidatus Lokiarchaeota archaeon]